MAVLRLPRRTTAQGMRDAVILGLILGCGLNSTELVELSWNCYHKPDRLTVRGKCKRVRQVGVPPWLAADLERWFRHNPHSRIIPVNRVSVWLIVRKYFRRLDPSLSVSPLMLRRAHAQLSYRARTPLPILAQSLGHRDILTTLRYLSIPYSGPGRGKYLRD